MERVGAVNMKGKPATLVGPELKVGDKAPDFACVNTKMEKIGLAETTGRVRIFSVVPSLDTPVCDMQTKRFNDEMAKTPEIDIYSISVDLPFAERRYCDTYGIDDIKMLSDHRDVSFGTAYGALLKDLRILARSIFVLDRDDTVRYVEYVPEVTDHPNYDAALEAAKKLL